ncbi:DUF177 domain-containing protein [Paracoccus sp. p4-l81]|uniref:YceD family protein n=1 Tax=unclassified Paracoccus (in: a-proteobacteria) TaxID=2688777 RepID=UPI0035B75C1F
MTGHSPDPHPDLPPPPPSGLGPRLRVAHLDGRNPTPFDVAPDADQRAALAEWAGISAIPALRMQGQIAPAGRDDWQLTARLTGRVVQPCVITLAPVTSPISDDIRRRYSPHVTTPEGDEVEMPEDDTLEPLGPTIDLGLVLVEALELALPLYPRAEGANFEAPVDADPSEDDPAPKPFAVLADLLAKKGD